MVQRFVPQGRLLDVGCATGDFLAEVRRIPGWSAIGLEPGAAAAHYVRHEVGLDVVRGTLNTAAWKDAIFDVLTLWDVLEHVYDPRTVLHEAARLLKPGGVLVINYPNLDSLDRRLFGRYWCGYELPRHLTMPPIAVLRHELAAVGLREVARRCLYGSYSASVTSLEFALNDQRGVGNVSALVRRILLSLPLRIVTAPVFRLLDSLGRGSNITLVFQREA
jgi:SAM-dependent methyltransferase